MPADLSNKPGDKSGIPSAPEGGLPDDASKKAGSVKPDSGAGRRRIEALRDRQALREALGDIFDDDPEIDDEIFNVAHEDDQYFIKPVDDPAEDESFDKLSGSDDIDDVVDDEIDDEIED
jgi:hypothetical protein